MISLPATALSADVYQCLTAPSRGSRTTTGSADLVEDLWREDRTSLWLFPSFRLPSWPGYGGPLKETDSEGGGAAAAWAGEETESA